jgi:hypothetical protein
MIDDDKPPILGRSIREVRLDAVLNSLTTAALKKAAAVACDVDGFDAVEKPTSLRLTRRTLAFYEALASQLGISRNSIITMVLDHLMNTATPET